ncbi:MAG TPA: type III pantothenate kinase, partial [Spirochaetota bacterium]|nr:type III pantothenate kinase [Spirochaetota bacterium]
MILGFNIGNTNTVMGIYDEDNPEPVYATTYPTRQTIQSDELSHIIYNTLKQWDKRLASSITGVIYSSVVPQSNTTYNKTIEELFKVTVHSITHLSKMPIRIEYDNPAQLGVDRIVNAVAAFTDYACDCIIVDIGT